MHIKRRMEDSKMKVIPRNRRHEAQHVGNQKGRGNRNSKKDMEEKPQDDSCRSTKSQSMAITA